MNSLAGILDQDSIGGIQIQQDTDQDTGNNAELLTYLHHHYDDPPIPDIDLSTDDRYLTNNIVHTPIPHRTTPPPPRSPSPLDPDVQIPRALAEVALTTRTSLDHLLPKPLQTTLDYDILTRGEMGGKIKKPRHERAGWKEMAEDDARPRKKQRNDFDDLVGYTEEMGTTLETDLANARADMGLGEYPETNLAANNDEGEAFDSTGRSKGKAPMTKEKRAEQNRKAQQAFRRRREEHIHQLERDSAALEKTQLSLAQAEKAIREVTLMYEGSKIESAALQATLRSFGSSAQFLLSDGSLVLKSSDPSPRLPGPYTEQQFDAAFIKLGRQSRELAKSLTKPAE